MKLLKFIINHQLKIALILVLNIPSISFAQTTEISGRFSMLGSTAQAEQNEIGYIDENHKSLSADQQSLRLMLDGNQQQQEWAMHIKAFRQHIEGGIPSGLANSDLFRYSDLSHNAIDEQDADSLTQLGYEIDRLAYKVEYKEYSLSLGRQPIDYGSGRLWQPLNIYGAFAPNDLDTDYKPGIDGAILEWYPSAFSSLTAAYIFSPHDNQAIDNSASLYYRRQVGEESEISLIAGKIIGNNVLGGAFESSWSGMGWRIEASHYDLDIPNENAWFWIAGIDYQFDNGTLVALEWYNNGLGTGDEQGIANQLTSPRFQYQLQQHLGKHLLGLILDKDITPLLKSNYLLLLAKLDDTNKHAHSSLMHQINFTYSVSNESDLLVSFTLANGKKLSTFDQIQSEFGHIPDSMTLRLRFYF